MINNVLKCLLLSMVLVACNKSTPNKYEMVSVDRWTQTTIKVIWESRLRIDDICQSLGTRDGGTGHYNACSKSSDNDINVCEIHAVRPDDFDDSRALEVLGHEAWHCFGAKHK
jgi:hypothetical protein